MDIFFFFLKKKIGCLNDIGLSLLEDVFDCQTVEMCEKFFDYLNSRASSLTKVSIFFFFFLSFQFFFLKKIQKLNA